jgi:predicted phage terminase large subunit-like protein
MLVAPSRAELEAERCRRSLSYFTRAVWPLIEPATQFVPNWHIDVIAEHLEAVRRREIRKLIINIPPRCMKSVSVAVCWPMWQWLDDPSHQWMFMSYAEKLSLRDSLKCRRLIETRGVKSGRDRGIVEQLGYQGLLRALHGDDAWSLTLDQNAKGKFQNTSNGYRLATSVAGTATGEGADTVVIDDPHKAAEAESDDVRRGVCEWHDTTVPTRFNDPKRSAEVLIMQRLHQKDLTGHLISKGGWTHLCLPMQYEAKHPFVWPDDPRTKEGEPLWSARIGIDEITTLKKDLGGYNAAGQLQQRPAPAEGLMFKRANFRRWRLVEDVTGAVITRTYQLDGDDGELEHVNAGGCRVFQTCDVAASDKQQADYTVVSTWAITPARQLLLLEVERQQFDTLDVAGFLRRKNREHGDVPIWIEIFGAGRGPYKSLTRQNTGEAVPVMALKPEHGTQLDKIARAWPAVAAYEAHDIFHPQDASWLGDFETELLGFPNAENDDQVDTVSYAARLRTSVSVGAVEARKEATPAVRPTMSGMRSEQF